MSKKIREARMVLEAQLSHNEIHDKLRDAIKAKFPDSYVWLDDVYDSEVIASVEGKEGEDTAAEPSTYWRFGYVLSDDGEVTLGAGQEVERRVVYEPVSRGTAEAEDVTLSGDFIPLVEKAVRADGTVPIKIIAPGQGSSGFYPAEVLQRDGPGVFAAGTKMYVDHPTAAEEAARPERSLRDLAAELVTPARWEEQGAAGPGLYAEAKVFEPWQPFLEELAPHIGVSINAMGKYRVGDAAGQKTPIIDAIVAAKSVDFVTTPGAGGQILSLYEAARSRVVEPQPHSGGEDVDETKLREAEAARDAALAEAQAAKERAEALEAENARLKEAEVIAKATEVAGSVIHAREDLHELTRARLVKEAVKSLPLKDGALDTEALKEAAENLAAEALKEYAAVTESGKVKGMGGEAGQPESGQLFEAWKAKYRSEGYDEATAEQLAQVASGR